MQNVLNNDINVSKNIAAKPKTPPKASPLARLIKIASIVCSLGVILWVFAAPLRRSSIASASVDDQMVTPIDPVEKVTRQRSNSMDFRDVAIALDHEFMRSLAKQKEQTVSAPAVLSSEEVRQRLTVRNERVRDEVRSLADAENGSVQWGLREDLLRTMEDASE